MPPQSLLQRFRRLDAYAQNKILDEFRVKSPIGGLGRSLFRRMRKSSVLNRKLTGSDRRELHYDLVPRPNRAYTLPDARDAA